ncbi:hypothetical protein [Actinoplanes sp. URMC 104]|uniref:hypothetical protein n=1 Tax=Actinoplanes sp. URMC 104 TaxID=3423409 RepID=UPI003F1E1181
MVTRLRLWLRAWLLALRGERNEPSPAAVPGRAVPSPAAAAGNLAYTGPERRAYAGETGAGRRALDRRAVEALAAERSAGERLTRERTAGRGLAGSAGWSRADSRQGQQVWAHPAQARRAADGRGRNTPPPARRDGHPERLGGPDVQPRPAAAPWAATPWTAAPGAAQPPRAREVGTRRRRIQATRQSQPDLRVINGEGTGTTSGRRARLRPVKD